MTTTQVKHVKLGQLARQLPGEGDWAGVFNEVEGQSDRGAALIAGGLVDSSLRLALACLFVESTPQENLDLFEGSGAPLGSFFSRIKVGRALGVYGPTTEAALHTIRKVRNEFAHAVMPITFEHPTIDSACAYFPQIGSVTRTMPPQWSAARTRFITACYQLTGSLIKFSFDRGGREIEIELP